MVDLYIKMKDNSKNHIIETLFTEYAGLTKDTDEHYYSDDDVLASTYGRCWDLMHRKWFRDLVIELKWSIDGEEEELKDFMTSALIKRGKI